MQTLTRFSLLASLIAASALPAAAVTTIFAPGVTKESGWYDTNKAFTNQDSQLCWAATATNIVAWWLDTYQRKGGDLIKVFRFVNDGDSPLVIKKVAKSCSCITVDFSRKPVKPNEAGEIRIKYEPHKAEPGIFHKVVQIYTNTKKAEHLIMIQGKSVAKRRHDR